MYLCAGSVATGRIYESRTIHGQGREIADVGIERNDVLVAANTPSYRALTKQFAVRLCTGTVGAVQGDGVGIQGVHSAHGVNLRREPVVKGWLEVIKAVERESQEIRGTSAGVGQLSKTKTKLIEHQPIE